MKITDVITSSLLVTFPEILGKFTSLHCSVCNDKR